MTVEPHRPVDDNNLQKDGLHSLGRGARIWRGDESLSQNGSITASIDGFFYPPSCNSALIYVSMSILDKETKIPLLVNTKMTRILKSMYKFE